LNVILSFAHKGLERFYHTGATSGIQAMHAKRLRIILTLLDAAVVTNDMDAPGLRLHRLKGEKKDLWAVAVQANWRVTFRFKGGNAEIVNYEDYH
jgi:proteic killer suppression protein